MRKEIILCHYKENNKDTITKNNKDTITKNNNTIIKPQQIKDLTQINKKKIKQEDLNNNAILRRQFYNRLDENGDPISYSNSTPYNAIERRILYRN